MQKHRVPRYPTLLAMVRVEPGEFGYSTSASKGLVFFVASATFSGQSRLPIWDDAVEKSWIEEVFLKRVFMRRIFCLTLVVLLAGCVSKSSSDVAGDQTSEKARKIRVIATVGMVADLVRTIGQSNVEVTQIMGPGVDPHLYKATRDDVQAIMQGDLVFYSGLMLEGKMIDTLVKLGRGKRIVAVTEGLDETLLLEPEDFQGHYDPHVWMDASAWAQCCKVISDQLSEFDPSHKDAYVTAAQALEADILKMHQYGKDCIASVPEASRVLITSHDAFNYFGRAYGIEVMGIQGISTESEAGLQRINDFVDLIVDRKVQAVFVESSVPRKNIDSLIEGAKSRGHDIKVGGELFSDAMGLSGTYEGTYLGMLDHNITTVTRALGGTAPERGMAGKLGAKDKGL